MRKFEIVLSSINDAKNFANIAANYDFDVDLSSGRYIVDGKSVMGILSLDLNHPIKVEIHSDECDLLVDELKPYIV